MFYIVHFYLAVFSLFIIAPVQTSSAPQTPTCYTLKALEKHYLELLTTLVDKSCAITDEGLAQLLRVEETLEARLLTQLVNLGKKVYSRPEQRSINLTITTEQELILTYPPTQDHVLAILTEWLHLALSYLKANWGISCIYGPESWRRQPPREFRKNGYLLHRSDAQLCCYNLLQSLLKMSGVTGVSIRIVKTPTTNGIEHQVQLLVEPNALTAMRHAFGIFTLDESAFRVFKIPVLTTSEWE